jgi:hypothetical protein
MCYYDTNVPYKSTFNTVCHRRPLKQNRNTPKHIFRKPGICQVHFQLFAIRNACFQLEVDGVWNVMQHAQKQDFVFWRNGRVHLNRRGRQFSRLLAGELCTYACRVCTARASPCSAVTWRSLVTHSILLFPLHFSSRASPCAITFQLESKTFSTFVPNFDNILLESFRPPTNDANTFPPLGGLITFISKDFVLRPPSPRQSC